MIDAGPGSIAAGAGGNRQLSAGDPASLGQAARDDCPHSRWSTGVVPDKENQWQAQTLGTCVSGFAESSARPLGFTGRHIPPDRTGIQQRIVRKLGASSSLVFLLVLPIAAVGLLGALAWRSAGLGLRAELDRQGDALLSVVRTTVQESEAALASYEEIEKSRLLSVARRVESVIKSAREPVGPLLQRIAAEERLGHMFLVDSQGRRVAHLRHPPEIPLLPGDEEPIGSRELVWQHAHETIARVPTLAGSHLEEGVAYNAFGVRERLGLALRFADGSVILVRAEQAAVERASERHRVEAVIKRLATVPNVRGVSVATLDGEHRASARAGGHAGEEVQYEGEIESHQAGPLRTTVSLSLDRVATTVATERRNVLIWSGLALVTSLLGIGAYVGVSLKHETARARLAAEAESARRMAEVGALAAMFVHEVSNPLNALALEAACLESEASGASHVRITRMRDQLSRARESMEAYLRIAGAPPESKSESYGQADVSRTVAELLAETRSPADVSVIEQAAGVVAHSSPMLLDLSVRSLVRNALGAAMSEVVVRCRLAGDCLVVEVDDDGPGFPEALLAGGPRLGLSLRKRGHGVGLALASGIARRAGGKLTLGRSPLGGARAALRIPTAEPPPSGGGAPS